ncbi:hypothetical protein [Streptomyces sp. NPDC050759]|uniref:hypothetical protein n=1 Tax=Streptomyces sp. NPDC050759 TaxID=3365635 RepID=UPI0037BD80FB
MTLGATGLLTGTAHATGSCTSEVIHYEVDNAAFGTHAADLTLTINRCTLPDGTLVAPTATYLQGSTTTWGDILYGAGFESVEGTGTPLEISGARYRLRNVAVFQACLAKYSTLCFKDHITFETLLEGPGGQVGRSVDVSDDNTDWDVNLVS